MNVLKLKKYILVLDFFVFTGIVLLGFWLMEFDFHERSAASTKPAVAGERTNKSDVDVPQEVITADGLTSPGFVPAVVTVPDKPTPPDKPTTQENPPEEEPIRRPEIQLMGIIFDSSGEYSCAYFAVPPRKNAWYYLEGESITPDYKVEKILFDKVVIKHKTKGKEFIFYMDEALNRKLALREANIAAGSSKASQKKYVPWTERNPQRIYNTLFDNEFAEIKKAAEDFSKNKQQGIDIQWIRDGDQIRGLKLNSLPGSHILNRFAKKGDILLNVNGEELAGDTATFKNKLQEIFIKYRNADFTKEPIYFVIERNGIIYKMFFNLGK